MEVAHAVPNHGSKCQGVWRVRDGKFHSDYLSGNEFTCSDRAQSSLGDLDAATVDTEVTVLPQHLHNKR